MSSLIETRITASRHPVRNPGTSGPTPTKKAIDMPLFIGKRLCFWLGIVLLPLPAVRAGDEAVSFKRDVAPILVRKCLGCHNDKKAESGLNMRSFSLLKAGGKVLGSEIIVPGDPDSSYLIELIRPDGEPRMPYKLSPLAAREIAVLERWVKQGARFDAASEADTQLVELVDPLQGLPQVELKQPTADPITALAFTADGKTLAVGQGRKVILFDTASHHSLGSLDDHPGAVTAVCFTTDGRTLVAAGGRPGQFGSVVVWDLPSKTRRHDLRGHADSILDAALSPDGTILATASYDRHITLWEIRSGKPRRTLKEHTDAVHGLAFSHDGKRLASASADRTIKIWDVESGQRRISLADATAEQYAVLFAPDDQTLIAAGVDRSIRSWRIRQTDAELLKTVLAHDAPVLRLLNAPDQKSFYSCSEDRTVKVWDLNSLTPKAVLSSQSDWPLAVAVTPNGQTLAIGRYDGALELIETASGKSVARLIEPPKPPPPPKPELVRNATLGPPSPRGARRGGTVRIQLTGNGVGRADLVSFPEPGIQAQIVLNPEKPDPNRLQVDLTISPTARVGLHRFFVRTPLGVPAPQNFVVSAFPELSLTEPNDDAGAVKTISLPATLIGAMDVPGDVDFVRFPARPEQPLVFEAIARSLGSGLNGTLAVVDSQGRILAEARDTEFSLDPLLIFHPPAEGEYTLRISDAEFGGSGNHFYRINAGAVPYVERVFPLGVEAGRTTAIQVEGVNLGALDHVDFTPAPDTPPGTIRTVPVTLPESLPPTTSRPVVVAEGAQGLEIEPNDEPAQASLVAFPGGVSGRIQDSGDVDLFRFEAKKGRRVLIETYGQRLGSTLDPVLEVLDSAGQSVPRAVLRPVAETHVAFRDHGSAGRNIRLTVWNDLAMGDHVLIGRELLRLTELPRNPDDDAVFWGLGIARISPGERIAALETTPEQHPMGQLIRKVEIHPPGTIFPPGGAEPVTLYHRNDDGGPGFRGDSRLTFDPPADGTYLVRVEDARNQGGVGNAYHLVIRPPHPDFVLSLSTENPNVPRGGTTVITASLQRIDGFDGPVEVALEGLPDGLSATSTRIERDLFAADIMITARDTAPASPVSGWQVVARAKRNESGSQAPEEVVHTLDPGGPDAGWMTVTPRPNLTILPETQELRIRPGERIAFKLSVQRGAAFNGRVPIELRNLPWGVRVLNIGLNGILVTEKETERSVFLYAEPWVEPQSRFICAVGKCEAAGTEHGSPPMRLTVLPGPPSVPPVEE